MARKKVLKNKGKSGKKTRLKKKQNRKKKKNKATQSRKACWDPFPVFAHEVHDVNHVGKVILLLLICIFMCLSIFAVGFGSYILTERKRRDEVVSVDSVSEFLLNLSIYFITSGIITTVVLFCGFIGVLRENIVLIRVLYIILIIFLVVKLAGAIFCLILPQVSQSILKYMFTDTVVTDYQNSSDVTAVVDFIQLTVGCCGVRDNGFMDWGRSSDFNCSEVNPSPQRCGVPWSCCRNNTGVDDVLCGRNMQKVDRSIASRSIFTKGCALAIQDFVEAHAVALGLLALLGVIIMIIVIFMLTTMVNDLQMIGGVYRGPWWIWIGKPRPKPPPGTPPTPLHWGPAQTIHVTGYMAPHHRSQMGRPPPRKPLREKQKPLKEDEQEVNAEQVFATSFKGTVTSNDETVFSELAEAALSFLAGSAEGSYFCNRVATPDNGDDQISVASKIDSNA